MCKLDNLETLLKHLKPIPKNIIKKIKKIDKKQYPYKSEKTRFYTYFTKIKKELCSITVAVKEYKKQWYCKQIVIHGLNFTNVYLRDITMTMGCLSVGWFRDGISKIKTYRDYDWGYNEDKYFKMETATIINKEYILTIPEFKYSAVDKYTYHNIIDYLRLYKEYPQAELLVKAGLQEYSTSKTILNNCKKDKSFCKWLYKNKNEITKHCYYIPTLLTAYKEKQELEYTQQVLEFHKNIKTNKIYEKINKEFENDLEKLFIYIKKQNTTIYNYNDYLNACKNLEINIKENKNRYPHDFKRWHDIRIDEYKTKKAEIDKKEKAKLYEQFETISQKYKILQKTNNKDNYICLIALNPNELIQEGEELHHCVGKMGYEQKFIREESLIFFIRNKNEQSKPFVTVEYSIPNKKILQIHGEYNNTPENKVLNYIKNKWLPYANKKIAQLNVA